MEQNVKEIKKGIKVHILNTDKILFNKNWIKKDINETNKLMKDFIDNNESWIIEGNATKWVDAAQKWGISLGVRLDSKDIFCHNQWRKKGQVMSNEIK